MTHARPQAVTGALSMQMTDGTVLNADTDISLARQWAEHLHGPTVWAAMTMGQQAATIADALAEIRRAYSAG